jgi:hypothetical protein
MSGPEPERRGLVKVTLLSTTAIESDQNFNSVSTVSGMGFSEGR